MKGSGRNVYFIKRCFYVLIQIFTKQKTPIARVGIAIGAYCPSTHPRGTAWYLVSTNAVTSWLKGLVYMQLLSLKDGGYLP